MRINEVDTGPGATPDPDKLLGLVQFLNGRATDTNSKKQISQQAFISLAQSLGINITPLNIEELVGQPPLSNVLEPIDPNSNMITYKGGSDTTAGPVKMPVNKAQDIVAKAAKSAMKRGQK
jgi:hypothetical protein